MVELAFAVVNRDCSLAQIRAMNIVTGCCALVMLPLQVYWHPTYGAKKSLTFSAISPVLVILAAVVVVLLCVMLII